MKKAKAIELLKLAVPIKALTQQEYSDFVEAVNMGMDALEHPTSSDTIDRKAALDALRKCQTYLYDARDPELKIELSSAETAINNLPTIQPVATDTNVGNNSVIPNSSDAVSRQAAIDALDCISGVEEVLKSLPSVQPEPKGGHWIEGGIYRDVIECYCSECGQLMTTAATVRMNYCPHCGAKMINK